MFEVEGHFPRAVEDMVKEDYASISEGGYVSGHIWELSIQCIMMAETGYDPNTIPSESNAA